MEVVEAEEEEEEAPEEAAAAAEPVAAAQAPAESGPRIRFAEELAEPVGTPRKAKKLKGKIDEAEGKGKKPAKKKMRMVIDDVEDMEDFDLDFGWEEKEEDLQ
jgi:hypothetical protein